MELSGNIPLFNIPGTLFGSVPRNFWKLSKSGNISCSAVIPRTYISSVGYMSSGVHVNKEG